MHGSPLCVNQTPLHHSTKHGNLLATAKLNGVDFISPGKHPSLASTQFIHKMEFTWGVYNTRLLTWTKSLKCPMCGQFISYGHMASNYPSMSGLRQDRHSRALHFLLNLLEQSNGGRWEAITSYFGNKPIKTFTYDSLSDLIPHLNTPSLHHHYMPTRRVYAGEGLDHSSPSVAMRNCMKTFFPHNSASRPTD
jgi:hypothetical protein